MPDFTGFNFDSTVVANGRGDVVAINLGGRSSIKAALTLVTASISTTAGKSFSRSVVVNDDTSNDARCYDPGFRAYFDCDCRSGVQDMPSAAFDMTADPPELWVAWRHNGHGTYGICTRKGRVVGDDIHWDTNPTPVNGIHPDTGYGVGGIYIQAGHGIPTIVYRTSDHNYLCQDGDANGKGVVINAATSVDAKGGYWADTQVAVTQDFAWCLWNGQVENSLRAFSYVKAASSTGSVDYVAFHSAPNEIRIFSSSGGSTWRELCDPAPGLVPPSWLPVVEPCLHPAVVSPNPSVLFPTLAVDADGRLALTYHESDKEYSRVRYVFRGSTDPLAAHPIWQGKEVLPGQQPAGLSGDPLELSPLRELPPVIGACDVDCSNQGVCTCSESHGPRVFGDYETMVPTMQTTTCGKAGSFWAGFAQIDDTNARFPTITSDPPAASGVDVVTREIILSPP